MSFMVDEVIVRKLSERLLEAAPRVLYRGFAHTFKRIVPRGKGEREYQQSDADSASPHLNIYQPPDYRYAVYHRFNPSFSHIPYSSSIRSLVLR